MVEPVAVFLQPTVNKVRENVFKNTCTRTKLRVPPLLPPGELDQWGIMGADCLFAALIGQTRSLEGEILASGLVEEWSMVHSSDT